jgi:hypothetical protein
MTAYIYNEKSQILLETRLERQDGRKDRCIRV